MESPDQQFLATRKGAAVERYSCLADINCRRTTTDDARFYWPDAARHAAKCYRRAFADARCAHAPWRGGINEYQLYGSGSCPLLQFDFLDAVPDQRCRCRLRLEWRKRTVAAKSSDYSATLSRGWSAEKENRQCVSWIFFVLFRFLAADVFFQPRKANQYRRPDPSDYPRWSSPRLLHRL